MAQRKSRKSRSIREVRVSSRSSALNSSERLAYERALALLSDLRRDEGSYSKLLRKHSLNSRAARRYLGRNLSIAKRGQRVRASKSDRLVREILFPTALGDVPLAIHGSRASTKLSEYFRDRDKLLHGKMSAKAFEGKWQEIRIDGKGIFADSAEILQLGDADLLKIEHIYSAPGGAE
jgi:hypothetical protein